MKYRLKDKELLMKLDELSDGDFSRQLEEHKEQILTGIKYQKLATLWFASPDGPLLSIEITPDMLEKAPEFDPHKWNDYPEVTPPDGVWMRCEYHFCDGQGISRNVARFNSAANEWQNNYGGDIFVTRFRSWIGPEEDEE